MFDYFDVLHCKELTERDKSYRKYLGIMDPFDNYQEYKVVVNSLEIVSVLDRDKNEITFPKEVNKNSFTKGSHKNYYYEIIINVNIDYYLV